MSGIFGIVSDENCVDDLYYGTDYHSHLGTKNAGMAVFDGKEFKYDIKGISSQAFRPQLHEFKRHVRANSGIGVISDYEPQPLLIHSKLGDFAIVHVGKIRNVEEIVESAHNKNSHFSEMSSGKINPTEVVSSLIGKGKNYADGIEIMQNSIEGSSSIMILTKDGIYLSRDKFGRTPIVTGKKNGATAATLETCAFQNNGFKIERYLGPGEIGIITNKGYEQIKKPNENLQICSFLWIYYGFPASNYEGINSEITRNKFGAVLARQDKKDIESGKLKIDFVAGIPDSGIGSGLGYAQEAKLPYLRPYAKYTPTWQRSFMPQEQEARDLVAEMKLVLIPEIIDGKSILYTEDSIVRATQLMKKVKELIDNGAREVHMRPSCPPLTHGCSYLNFSMSKNIFDLAAVRAITDIEGIDRGDIKRWNTFNKNGGIDIYLDENSEKYESMVGGIKSGLGLTSLRYPRLDDMVSAIGLPKEKLCLGCWRDCGSCNKL